MATTKILVALHNFAGLLADADKGDRFAIVSHTEAGIREALAGLESIGCVVADRRNPRQVKINDHVVTLATDERNLQGLDLRTALIWESNAVKGDLVKMTHARVRNSKGIVVEYCRPDPRAEVARLTKENETLRELLAKAEKATLAQGGFIPSARNLSREITWTLDEPVIRWTES